MSKDRVSLVANRLWRTLCGTEYRRFRRQLDYPGYAQHQRLNALIRRNAPTAFGRAHDFAGIRSLADFRARVPIRDYAELRPWIEAENRGQAGTLTHDPPAAFIATSGSTSGAKRIPYNRAFQAEFQRGVKAWMADLYRKEPGLMGGAAYWSISPPAAAGDDGVDPDDADDSRYLGGVLGSLVARTLAVKPATAGLPTMAAFDYATLLQLLRRADLRLLSVWHPSFFTRLLDQLPAYWSELIDDVRTGRSSLDQQWLAARPMPRRAARLAELEPHQVDAIWPELRLISCWGDSHSTAPARELHARFPRARLQPKGLLATEGLITIPQLGEGDGGNPLAIRSHVYEFLDSTGQPHAADGIHEGEDYDVVLTAANGLWRYRLDDRVTVTGFLGRTPCLKFRGRGNETSDYQGEKLDEPFVRNTLDALFRARRLEAPFAMLVLDDHAEPPRYQLLLEADQGVDEALATDLDARLRANPHYAICRDLGQLGPIKLQRLGAGTHERYLNLVASHGADIGGIKPRPLSDSREWLDALAADSTGSAD